MLYSTNPNLWPGDQIHKSTEIDWNSNVEGRALFGQKNWQILAAEHVFWQLNVGLKKVVGSLIYSEVDERLVREEDCVSTKETENASLPTAARVRRGFPGKIIGSSQGVNLEEEKPEEPERFLNPLWIAGGNKCLS